ncbi:MAG: recO [Chloroflexi bacterium]|jgi:DNA repair protein RecO (recombination protein O)|nr:recO [Chloroflexota bacterium]
MVTQDGTAQPDALHRQRSFRVEAVVLRHSDWGEADRLLVLYTLEMGKLRALAKGARKPRSRKAGHLEPYTRVSLQLARGRDIPIVSQAETLDPYLRLREELLLSTYASYVVELLDRFTYEEGENRSIYRLLADTLSRLCTQSSPELAVRYYEIRLLDLLGFRPQLFQCSSCGAEIQPQDQFFSAALGGVLCPQCGRDTAGALPVSMPALKYLRHFQRSSFSEAARVTLSAGINREMEALMQHYLTYLLERGLNTPAFLRRVRRIDQDEPPIAN